MVRSLAHQSQVKRFGVYAQLTTAGITFITRAKSNLASVVECTLRRTAQGQEAWAWVGKEDERQRLRLIQVLYQGQWYRYLTNELDSERLPILYAVALYGQRWRIEDAYHIVKRLWGLAYFWVGSHNGVALPWWATWLLYAVLVDLTDAVAERLHQPCAALSCPRRKPDGSLDHRPTHHQLALRGAGAALAP